MIEQWKRLWFVLDETKLFYVADPQEDGSYHSQTVCDLMLASVRERKGENDLPFSFEIAFANFESTVVQAEGQKEFLSWITELRNTIAKRLTSGDSASVIAKKTKQRHSSIHHPHSDGSTSADTTNGLTTRRRRNTEQITQLFSENVSCAECARDSPEWVSLNLGCLVCIDCSGVHRSMGVHISKMRSLKLDDLEVEEYLALQEAGQRRFLLPSVLILHDPPMPLGNEMCNQIWEASVPKSFKKPDLNSPYSERDKFIRAKYDQRLFLDPPFEENQTEEGLVQWIDLLVRGCTEGNPADVLNALAHGVEPTDDQVMARHPVHLACQRGSLVCVYLLVMNGFDIYDKDDSGLTSLETAEAHQHTTIASFLRKRQDLRIIPKNKDEIAATASPTAPTEMAKDTLPTASLEPPSSLLEEAEQSGTITPPPFAHPDPENPFYDDDLKMI
jgi:Arf-GAP with coiled-coil, ANK repeat and PH domain-containing protein